MASPMIDVATRKGLFSLDENGRIVSRAFLGDPVSAVLRDRSGQRLLAALALGHFGPKLRRSTDGGSSWEDLAPPAFPQSDDERAPAVSMIWTLARPHDADAPVFAGTLPGGLFRSDDFGDSWTLVESLWNRPERARWNGGGYDEPGIHTVLFDPRNADRITLGVSTGGVWKTADGGRSWTQHGRGLKATYMPPGQEFDLNVQDVHRLAMSPAAPDRLWCQHHVSAYRSDDGGETFADLGPVAKPSAFGFAVAAHPSDPDTAWFVPAQKDERRIPVDDAFVVSVTRDGGKSFQTVSAGLPSSPAFDLVYRHGLDVDHTGDRLAMGSTTGGLWLSSDSGSSWRLVDARMPPIAQVAFVPPR